MIWIHCTVHFITCYSLAQLIPVIQIYLLECTVLWSCYAFSFMSVFFFSYSLLKEYNNCPILSSFPSLTSWQTQYLPCIVIFLAYEIYTYSYDTMWFLLMYVYIVYNDQIRVNYLSSQVFIILLHYFLLNIFVVFLLLQLLKILFLSLECEHPGNNSYVYFSGKCLILMNIILRSYFQGIQIFFFFY